MAVEVETTRACISKCGGRASCTFFFFSAAFKTVVAMRGFRKRMVGLRDASGPGVGVCSWHVARAV